ncbi:MAG: hypothetical protein RUMPE_00956 [Eubacteriales bacterium SKADARSKE-1]|nr:hypothetical protein [Eubacteriales bacterium SKADARSKE-1]
MHLTSLISLMILSIVELFLLRKFIIHKEKIALKSVITSLVFLWIIFIISYIFKLNVPDVAYILVIITLFMNSYLGYYFNLYYKTKKYDRIQHVLGSFSFAILLYFLFSNVFEYGGSKAFKAFYIFLLGVSSGTIHEIIEFINDLKHEEKMQRGLKDTNLNIVSNIIGSFSASILAFFVFL